MVFVIPPDSPVVRRILEAGKDQIAFLPEGQASDGARALLQDASALARLLEAVFVASTKAVEGRRIQGSVCIASPDPRERAWSLTCPVPLSDTNVVELSVASPGHPLAIHSSAAGISEIWGVVSRAPPMSICVKFPLPGVLVVTQEMRVIAVVELGGEAIPESSKLTPIILLQQALGADVPQGIRMGRAIVLLHIATAIAAQGHGGAIVVVPRGTRDWEHIVNIKYPFTEPATRLLADRVAERDAAVERERQLYLGQPPEDVVHATRWGRSMQDAVRETTRQVAALANLDGAVVMDDELSVLGFGAKLLAPDSGDSVFEMDMLHEDDKKYDVPVSQLGGTRHQSAARFIQTHKNSLALVASHDGPLTGFVWLIPDRRVLVIRNLHCFSLEI